MKVYFKFVCRENDKEYILKKEQVEVLEIYGNEERRFYTIKFNNDAKMDYVTSDKLEFIEEWLIWKWRKYMKIHI